MSQTSHDVTGTSDTITFDVANVGTGTGPMGWVAEANDSWLAIESGDYGENSGTITVHYDANSGEERTGTITIVAPRAKNGSQVITVNQAAKIDINELSVTTNSQDISATNGSFTFDIANTGNGTMNWTAQTDADWLTINNASGTNDGTITVNYTANSGDARTGTVTLTADGAENSPQTVEVKQESSPIPNWDGTLEGYKFIDTNNNGKYDTSETLVEGRHYIVMKPLSYAGSPFGALTDNGHYKFYNVKKGTYSIWQDVNAGWLTANLTTETEIKWSSDDPLTISVSDDGVRIDGNAQLLEKIDFPIPDFANQSSNVIPPEVKDQITAECENVDYVLCGLNSDDCPSNTTATVIDLTTTGAWPTTGAYGDIDVFAYKKISTFGTIYLPLFGNTKNVTFGSICNYGTLTLVADKYFYHPVVMDFNYWFINYGEVRGASAIPKWFQHFAHANDIERIEIRSKASWGLTGSFYNEGTIQGGNGKRFNYTGGVYLNTVTRIENKELIGFPQLKDLLQLNNLSVFKMDYSHCNDTGYTDGSLAGNQAYDYTKIPLKAALGALHSKDGDCYDYTNGGSINSLEPTDALSTGGDVRIEAANIYQNGDIEAGQGIGMNFKKKDDVPDYFNKLRFGGKGGDTTLRSTNMVFTKNSTTRGGKGGDITVEEGCLNCINIEVKGGQGGDLTIVPAGDESEISIYGMLEGDSIYVEPDIMLAGKDINIVARKDIVIFGGDNWKLVLNDLRDDAIVAGRDITIAVGDGGIVDLRGNTSKVFKAGGKVAIYADNVLLDQGVQLEDIIQASEIVRGPNKIIYRVVLDTQDVQGKANETIPVKLKVSNAGPKTDTYTLSVVSKKGTTISGLPSSITVEGLKQKQLDLSIVLPAEGNDTITITATSQADPTVVATTKIRATVAQKTTAEFSVSTTSGVAPLTVDLDASASVANGSIVSYKWTTSDGQTAESQNAQLTFNEVGDYTITLEVTDDKGATHSANNNVIVTIPVVVEYTISGVINDKDDNPITGVT
ncbi:MAG: BACON domain-containing carbohydrate-binding protein, partial [Candidatus Parabeggiatoa sp.]|nr:BACON domain-containing carbohydrate-binding protein [Candidatus Parabeggiatoa sp.]